MLHETLTSVYGVGGRSDVSSAYVDDPGYDMILGSDFLKAYRVLFSVKQQQFYFSYVGGRIFAIDH